MSLLSIERIELRLVRKEGIQCIRRVDLQRRMVNRAVLHSLIIAALAFHPATPNQHTLDGISYYANTLRETVAGVPEAVGDFLENNVVLTGPQKACKEALQQSSLQDEALVAGPDGANIRNMPNALPGIGGRIIRYVRPGEPIAAVKWIEWEGLNPDGTKGLSRWYCLEEDGRPEFVAGQTVKFSTQPSK